MENLYDKKIRARRFSRWFRVVWIVLCSILYFWVANLLVLIACQYAEYGFGAKNTQQVYRFLLKVREEPGFVFEAYAIWLKIFMRAKTYSLGLFIPWLSPLVFLLLAGWGYGRRKMSSDWMYRRHNRFAAREDVLKMPLFGNSQMFLGRFEGKPLSVPRAASVLVWGGDRLGKTSTIAVPSILESNRVSIVAVDDNGALAQYTSGHRFEKGRVFYFDWMKTDNPEKGEFWPRWNPLSHKDMPQKSEKREVYLQSLAAHLLPEKEDEYWRKLSNRLVEGILSFFVAKVEQAYANDYLLGKLIDGKGWTAEDKDIALSYYALMPRQYAEGAVKNVAEDGVTAENYLPVGSWDGIPQDWCGRELCPAMISDYFTQWHMVFERRQDENGWKTLLNSLIQETLLFNYGSKTADVLKEFFGVKPAVRERLFAMLIDVLGIFQNPAIRERTSASDYALKYARGMKNKDDGEWMVVTTYLRADTPEAAFMTRLMTDMLIDKNQERSKSVSKLPLMFVIDGVDRLPKFSELAGGVLAGNRQNVSFLLLTGSLKRMHEIYGRTELENIICGCTYKQLFAANNVELSRQFRELAVFGLKSVQLPALPVEIKVKQGISDAYYFRRIADELVRRKENKGVDRNVHVLLAEGFYNLPLWVDAECYSRNARLNVLSQKPVKYFLDEDLSAGRNMQNVPAAPSSEKNDKGEDESIVPEAGVVSAEPAEEAEIRHEDDDFEEPVTVVVNEPAAGAADVSEDEEWWLDENAFSQAGDVEENPFDKRENK